MDESGPSLVNTSPGMKRILPAKILGVVAAAFLSVVPGARAEMAALSKDFESYMLAHHYVAVALRHGKYENLQAVDASINGQKLHLLVDTGAPRSILTMRCAKDLGLEIHDTGKTSWGIGGKVQGTVGLAPIRTVELSCGEINRLSTIFVAPKSVDRTLDVDGIVGLDWLRLNAAVFPIGGTGILLKPGGTPAVDIRAYMTKLRFHPVPLDLGHGDIVVKGRLNKYIIRCVVDSGAAFTSFDFPAVKAALKGDVSPTSLTMEGMDGRVQSEFYFTPASFDLGGFSMSPLAMLADHAPFYAHSQVDGLIGADVLGLHRAVIDLGDGILWMR